MGASNNVIGGERDRLDIKQRFAWSGAVHRRSIAAKQEVLQKESAVPSVK